MPPSWLYEDVIADRYRVLRKIGGRSPVYLGVDVVTGEQVVVKVENQDTSFPELEYEARVYDKLNLFDTVGFLRKRWFGEHDGYDVLVLDVGGPSLKDLFLQCGRKLSLKTVLMLAIQLIDRLECVHSTGYIMRKIKPRDFIMGTGVDSHLIYPIDFGLFKHYRSPKTGEHIPYREDEDIMARVKYASVRVNFCVRPSRRDDMESLGYMLIYLLLGRLPWCDEVKQSWDDEGDRNVARKKASVPLRRLCMGLPREFEMYLRYCRDLSFEEEPDYASCRSLFRDLFFRKGYVWDNKYDWTPDVFCKLDPAVGGVGSLQPRHPRRDGPADVCKRDCATEEKNAAREQQAELRSELVR